MLADFLKPDKRLRILVRRKSQTETFQVPPFRPADVREHSIDAPAFSGISLVEFVHAQSVHGLEQIVAAPDEHVQGALNFNCGERFPIIWEE